MHRDIIRFLHRFLWMSTLPFTVACDPVEPTNSLCSGDGCRTTSVCGNFAVEGGEGCDDGNTTAGDGCSARCTVEPGYDCCGSPSVCGRKGGAPLAAGGAHTCAVRAALPTDPEYARAAGEALVCWGENAFGQLGRAHRERVGDDETPGSEPPVRIGGRVRALAAGSEHTCALLVTGAVRCFGNGKNGRLGYGRPGHIGDNEHPEEAGDVPLGGAAIALAAGDRHTCAVLENGTVRCWGAGENGVLGLDGTKDIGDDETPASVAAVTLVGTATAIAAGSDHTCALLSDGRVQCWGKADRGQIGHGRGTPPVTIAPSAKVTVELGETASAIGAGDGFTCAHLAKGGVRCWGSGPRGQLGLTSRVPMLGRDNLPTAAATIELDAMVAAMTVGRAHTCVRYVDGRFNCWGVGDDGRLGRASTRDVGWNEVPAKAGAVDAGGIVTQMAAGGAHTCLRLGAGYDVRCFGLGDAGQLGLGRTVSVGGDVAVADLGDINLVGRVCGDGIVDREEECDDGAVTAGDGCSPSCLVEHDWTCNGAPSVCAPRPAPVKVVTGELHGCVLTDRGAVRCFGMNDQGQLGLGHRDPVRGDVRAFADVALGGAARDIVAGANHTCALMEDGQVRCWGANGQRQLGYEHRDTIGDDEVPTDVAPVDVPTGVRQIAAAGASTCVLHDTSRVTCWGGGAPVDPETGVTLLRYSHEFGEPVAEIAVSTGQICARSNDGRVGCVGRNGWAVCGVNPCDDGGYCGDIDTFEAREFDTPPVWIAFEVPVASVAAAENAVCARLADGAVHCWGSNQFGQWGQRTNQFAFEDGDVPARVFLDVPATAIVGGGDRFCAITESRGLRCWGALPLGYPRDMHATRFPDPFEASDNRQDCGADVCLETPAELGDIDVGGQVVSAALTAWPGDGLACALTAAREVRCWGTAYSRFAGVPTFNIVGDDETPATVPVVPAGGTIIGLAYNDRTGLCVASAGQRLRCFGGTEGAQRPALTGYADIYSQPRDIPAPTGRHVRDVVMGQYHGCYLRDDGVVFCWGTNQFGELGVPGITSRPHSPAGAVQVDVGFAVRGLTAGTRHTCAWSNEGRVRCWGQGTWAKLGYRSNEVGIFANIGDNETPASAGDVDVGGAVASVAAGAEHTCALLATGRVRCWGSNFEGQVGVMRANATGAAARVLVVGDDESPASVGDVNIGGTAVAIAAGDRFTCAVLTTGAVRCWGDSALGQGGRGTTVRVGDDEHPASVGDVPIGAEVGRTAPSGQAVRTIAAGAASVCVTTTSGAVRCWGQARDGLLGQAFGRWNWMARNIGDDEPASDGRDVDVGGSAIGVRAGAGYGCAILAAGGARCWGPFAGQASRSEPLVGYDLPPSWVEPVQLY